MTELRKIEFSLTDFPVHAYDKVRWSDTDLVGHVNNAVFMTYCETGRSELLRGLNIGSLEPGLGFFVARMAIDFRAQLTCPGTVDIGTGIKAIGRSSVTFSQALFQNGICSAIAEGVLVRVRLDIGRPAPLCEEIKERMKNYMIA